MNIPTSRITIEPIQRGPHAFGNVFAKINVAFKVLGAIANMEGKGGIVITKSENNWIIEGGGVPAGYTEKTFTGCDSGTPFDYKVYIKRL